MKKTLLLSLLLLLTLVGRSWAQSRPVSGRVIDKSTNEGLPGVSVIVKGTTTGTATDADGRFALNVNNGAVLQFKYLGYLTSEQPVGASGVVDISLAVDNKQLDEVTVTALGISREKRALGYAVSEIKSEQVVQKSEPDLLRTISGKVPGVNILSSSGVPGASSRITIRGNTSFFGENQPLFIVDGVPYDNSQTESDNPIANGASYSSRTADVDPNNIASINVLKGAAAAALYGSRAAGGVIVITTKTGGGGARGAKGIQVGYTTGYSIEKIAALPNYQNRYGAGANFVNSSANGSWGPEFGNTAQGAPDSIAHPQAGNPDFPNIPAKAKIPYKAYPNNVKDFFNTGHLFENSLSLSSNNENSSFTTIISRADQQGIIPNSSFVRNNISAGGSGRFNKLTVSGNVAYTNTNQQGPLQGANNLLAGSASAFARTMFLTRSLDLQGLPYQDPVTKGPVFAWLTSQADNPLWSVENAIYKSRVDRIVGSVGLSYAIKDWLSVSYSGGINTYTDLRTSVIRPGSLANFGVSQVIEDALQNTEFEQTLLLNFNKNLTEDLTLTASMGQNINSRKFDGKSYIGTNIITFGIDNIENTAQKTTYGYAYSNRHLMGLLANAQLGYKNFAFVTLTARNDFSSTLNKDGVLGAIGHGNTGRSFLYSSAAVALVLNEALKLDYRWLDLAKVRVAYGRVGKDAPAYRSGAPGYVPNAQNLTNAFPFNGVSAISLNTTVNNPGLTPEFSTELELGTELTMFRNRISFNGTYYNKSSTNQIAYRYLPTATGFNTRWTNFGEISNKGFEVALTLVPVEAAGFRWSSTFNFTRNRNIVVSTTSRGDTLILGGVFNMQALLIPGQPYGVIQGSAPLRDPNGELYVNPITGRLIPNPTPQIIANPNPDFLMSFINQFTYKGLTLNMLVDYRKGGQLYSSTLQEELGRGVTKDTEDRTRLVIIDGVSWNPATQSAVLDASGKAVRNTTAISLNDYYFSSAGAGGGAATNGYNAQSIYDATTVRLREVTLGYDLPKKLLGKTPFGLVNLSVSARNLYWYSPNLPKNSNFDPETSTFGASNLQGFELTNAPNTKRYGVNLRVNF
ncbi:SusC/RagA family TonB-linked outer membrane protein [Hymenobacter rubidus]|uniref:SusC/RagA family TonB-linked outer membrane protein n=1 Tax=Hymenobacter rubidus TaxID=1441626 RepID=UPI00191F04CE|nr:SusC/RagA family TonB-linked outer membrane protein [Hymenobacter rubidus]